MSLTGSWLQAIKAQPKTRWDVPRKKKRQRACHVWGILDGTIEKTNKKEKVYVREGVELMGMLYIVPIRGRVSWLQDSILSPATVWICSG